LELYIKMNRYKPIGWRNESYRHSLAARGIKTVRVPPAWRNVKYYEDKSYIATGIDKKGRTQYIYPKPFSERKASRKYARIDRLEKQIPAIITSVKSDIKRDDNPEAEVVYTMYKTGFRPGTTKDTKADVQAYGASTLLKKHVKVNGDNVKFKFIAKKGVPVEKEVQDKLLADIMKRRKLNDKIFSTSDTQVRGYFDKKTHGKYNLKDLRTLRAQEVAKETIGSKKEMSTKVSEELGNTPAVAAGSYIQPKLLNEK